MIVTLHIVSLIESPQNRDARAIHLKLNEPICDVENLSDLAPIPAFDAAPALLFIWRSHGRSPNCIHFENEAFTHGDFH